MHSSANNVISTNFASRLLKTNFNMQEIESKLFADFAPVSTEEWEAKINADLTPSFKENPKVEERPKNDPPKKPGNKLVN